MPASLLLHTTVIMDIAANDKAEFIGFLAITNNFNIASGI